MKKLHIVLIVIIAVAIGAIISTISDSSTYATFSEAFSNPENEFHIVGQFNRERPTQYNPEKNADLFTFYMTDNQGVEKKVNLYKPKPQDFERSEQVVLIGKAKNGEFHATDILMKCPSKYNEGTPGQTGEEIATR